MRLTCWPFQGLSSGLRDPDRDGLKHVEAFALPQALDLLGVGLTRAFGRFRRRGSTSGLQRTGLRLNLPSRESSLSSKGVGNSKKSLDEMFTLKEIEKFYFRLGRWRLSQ